MDSRVNPAARRRKSPGQIFEIDRRIRQRNVEREAAGKRGRHFPDRPRAERTRPSGDFRFPRARKVAQLDHGNSGQRVAAEILQHSKGLERPRDHLFGWFGIVGIPNGGGRGRSRLRSYFVGQNGGAIPLLGQENSRGEA